MGDKWAEMIADANAYEMDSSVVDGTKWEARPPLPDLAAFESREIHVRRLFVHQVAVEARADERGKVARYIVSRLVAETEENEEIEISRTVQPLVESQDSDVDFTVCGACGGNIPEGMAEIYEGVAYHSRCMG